LTQGLSEQAATIECADHAGPADPVLLYKTLSIGILVAMECQKRIHFDIQKKDKNWAVVVDGQLVTLTVYRKGAVVLEALFRGLVHVTSRRLFRAALKKALAAADTAESDAPTKAEAKSA
jgi:hypothetical protein